MWWPLSSLLLSPTPKVMTSQGSVLCTSISAVKLAGAQQVSLSAHLKAKGMWAVVGLVMPPSSLYWMCFLSAEVEFGKGRLFEGVRWSTWPWGKRKWGEVNRKKEEDPGIFFLMNLAFFFLEILSVGWYLAREQGLRHESYLWCSSPHPLVLVTAAWEQADRSRVAGCQYRLQESISNQTGSEIGGGSYRFLRLFLVSFLELVWFRLVSYYSERGWDKHIPSVYQMLSVGSQFPETPGLASLWGRGVQARGRAKEVETVTVLLL